MTKSKTNLGGALMVLGSALTGVGVLTQFAPSVGMEIPHAVMIAMWFVALAGFIIGAGGKFVTAYFAADNSDVVSVAKTVDTINQSGPTPTAPPAIEAKTTIP